jgi:polyisoprenoid-binding protein YceI
MDSAMSRFLRKSEIYLAIVHRSGDFVIVTLATGHPSPTPNTRRGKTVYHIRMARRIRRCADRVTHPLKEFRMLRRIAGFAALALILAPVLAIAADFPLTAKNTTVKFIGAKPKGKHEGGFKAVSGTASVKDNDPTTLKITLDIDMESLYTDTDKLTDHLKGPDFFDVKTNPKAKFVSTKVEKSGDEYKITGDLTMLGKTKEITFPAKLTVADGVTLSSSFSIDRMQWGVGTKFGPGKIDTAVKMTVNVKTK